MPAPLLPDPIAAYFAADLRSGDAIARCFTPEAVVKDEGHTYRGREAIKAWKAAASVAYTYKSEPFAVEQKRGLHVVTSRVTGNFPGSPVHLRYRFRLERGLIAALEIAP
jgi:hypothetical protein